MAHFQQLRFVQIVKDALPEYFQNKIVLEVGSWDVNGTVRNHFSHCDYTGVDIATGPGVDLVCSGQDIGTPTDFFDTVVSCECFEHNRFWLETFVNMIRVLKPSGLCIVTCAARGRIEHGTRRRKAESSLTSLEDLPDYYKNLCRNDFERRISLDAHFASWGFVEGRYYPDLYFVGVKKGQRDFVEFCDRLQRVIAEARKISTAPGTTNCHRHHRFLVYTAGKILETVVGGRIYQNLSFLLDGIITQLKR